MNNLVSWHFDGHGVNDAEGQRIAKVSGDPYIYTWDGPRRNEEYDRLSNLIAAAPEMLEALETCVAIEQESTEWLRKSSFGALNEVKDSQWLVRAKVAIQKARGENQ